jgi:hypothetical protein
MSQVWTLQADLVITPKVPGTFTLTIPSGTVVTDNLANDLDALAEHMAAMSPAILGANLSQVDRDIIWPANTAPFTAGNHVRVLHGANGRVRYFDLAASASPSASPSSSGSSSVSRSPSSSASPSASPSSSASRSPSLSPSASPSAS